MLSLHRQTSHVSFCILFQASTCEYGVKHLNAASALAVYNPQPFLLISFHSLCHLLLLKAGFVHHQRSYD